MVAHTIRQLYWEKGAWITMTQWSSAEVSRVSKCIYTKWLEFYDWNSEVFKARDVDLEFICVEDSANIEIMVWE